MITSTVILLLCLSITQDVTCGGFRMYKYSRSVDTSQFTPQSPCPTVFQYQNDQNGDLIGAIKVDRTDHEGRLQLDVELSVGNSVQGYNGKITLADERQKVISDIMNRKPIFYRVHFPAWQNLPPRITNILVNGNQICSGPRIPIQMVPVLTTINLQHKLSLGVTPLISSSDPTVDSSTFNNLAPIFNTQGNTQYPFDVRVDNLPTVPNNIYTDNFNAGNRPESSSNPYLNVNNPYNFNPPSRHPPDDGPPRDGGGPPRDGGGPPRDGGGPPRDGGGPPRDGGGPPRGGGGPPRGPPPHNRPPPGRGPPYDDRPPPDNRPPPENYPSADTPDAAFPQNPFLVGLSTPQPPGENGGNGVGGDNFFDTRSSESPQVFITQTTNTPPRNGAAGTSNYDDVCGRPLATNSLVFNGQSVPRGAYPWLVAIFKQLDTLSLSYICSGSLISDRHVVTAAHCVKTEYRRVKPSEIICVFGKLNIRKWVTASGERMLEPDSIAVHPDYESGKANADIAVMTFADPISFTKMIRPVCLWQGSNDLTQVVGNIGTVVGWGRNENGDLTTAEPRQVNMPIVDQLECLKGSSSSVGQALVEIVSKNTFCAGFRNGSGPCNGDSGSAFLLRKNGIFYLRGIVSTALSEATQRSCNLKEYVVFTDASKYLDWLMRILGQS